MAAGHRPPPTARNNTFSSDSWNVALAMADEHKPSHLINICLGQATEGDRAASCGCVGRFLNKHANDKKLPKECEELQDSLVNLKLAACRHVRSSQPATQHKRARQEALLK